MKQSVTCRLMKGIISMFTEVRLAEVKSEASRLQNRRPEWWEIKAMCLSSEWKLGDKVVDSHRLQKAPKTSLV